MFLDFDQLNFTYVVNREVLEIVNDNVLIVRESTTDLDKLTQFSIYLIGKYADLNEQIQKLQKKKQRSSYKDPDVNHINTSMFCLILKSLIFDEK